MRPTEVQNTRTKLFIIALMLLSSLADTAAEELDCYPGLNCDWKQSHNQSTENVVDYSYTKEIVFGSSRNLVWLRDLYAIGNTSELLSSLESGEKTYAQTIRQIKSLVDNLNIAGIRKWRVATNAEVSDLLSDLGSPTAFQMFRDNKSRIIGRSVLAAVIPNDGDSFNDSIRGVIYTNHLQDESSGPASANLNPFGIWVVAEGPPEGSAADSLRAIKRFDEPRQILSLNPLEKLGVELTDAERPCLERPLMRLKFPCMIR